MAASQATKLGLKPGGRVVLDHAPDGWALVDPPAVELVDAGSADVVICFIRARAEVAERVEAWADAIRPAGSLWIAWPRRAAGHVTDNAVPLTRCSGRQIWRAMSKRVVVIRRTR